MLPQHSACKDTKKNANKNYFYQKCNLYFAILFVFVCLYFPHEVIKQIISEFHLDL